MLLGDVALRVLEEASSIAAVAAFAASVQGSRSTPEGIRRIGQSLGAYAAKHASIRDIASPLLGSGAGGLSADEAARALTAGFVESAPDAAALRICVINALAFEQLQRNLPDEPTTPDAMVTAEAPIRVFISYTKSSDEHSSFVLDLATKLRQNGIDARLDAWHLHPGMDLPQWMCNELDLADRVLLICDDLYRQKTDRRHGGVGWEIRVVQGDLLQTQQDNPDKYVPIIVSDNMAEGTPGFLKTVYAIHWPPNQRDSPARVQELVKAIYRIQLEAPPLGKPPSFVLERSRG
jgi:hypothetical protein